MPADKNLYLRSLTDKGDTAKNLRLRSEAEKISAKIRNLKAKVGGAWTAISKVSAKVGGSWTEVTLSAKAGGDWKVIHEK
jgi:hypothetical protein